MVVLLTRNGRLALDKRMQKYFPEHDIALYEKDEKETMIVNGVEIDLAWIPHSKNINDKGAFDILVKDCRLSIKRLLDAT
jgi:hypothetical protein